MESEEIFFSKESEDYRCDCGKLVFKVGANAIEFKCGRCKRVHFIKYESIKELISNVKTK